MSDVFDDDMPECFGEYDPFDDFCNEFCEYVEDCKRESDWEWIEEDC